LPRWRYITCVALLAVFSAACGSEPGPRRATSTPTSGLDSLAVPSPTYVLPTSVAWTATPTPPSTPRPRYVQRCAARVCELVGRTDSWQPGPPGVTDLGSYSPDRSQIVELSGSTIRVIDPRSGTTRLLATVGGQHNPVPPVWSPDGTMVAFESPRGDLEFPSIVVAMADGSRRWTVSGDGGGYTPTWSPDSRQVTFSGGPAIRNSDGSTTGVPTIVNVDGAGLRKITSLGGRSPVWMANDDLVFFLEGSGLMLALSVDGSNRRPLTTDGAYVVSVGHHTIPLSPDRRCVAYLREQNDFKAQPYRSDVYVACIDGPEHRITYDGEFHRFQWLTDGRVSVESFVGVQPNGVGPASCPGLLAVRIETDERECIVY
jgi:WD40-like Beta Propeller Repeat